MQVFTQSRAHCWNCGECVYDDIKQVLDTVSIDPRKGGVDFTFGKTSANIKHTVSLNLTFVNYTMIMQIYNSLLSDNRVAFSKGEIFFAHNIVDGYIDSILIKNASGDVYVISANFRMTTTNFLVTRGVLTRMLRYLLSSKDI